MKTHPHHHAYLKVLNNWTNLQQKSRFTMQIMTTLCQSQARLARIIAAAAPHSVDLLHAVPSSSVGTRLDDTSLRFAISLRLGAIICAPQSTHASVVSPSTVPVLMVLHSANRLVGLCDTTSSTTSLNGRWHRQMFLHCWNPSHWAETIVNVQMISLFYRGPTVAASYGLQAPGYSGRQSFEACRAEFKCGRKWRGTLQDDEISFTGVVIPFHPNSGWNSRSSWQWSIRLFQ